MFTRGSLDSSASNGVSARQLSFSKVRRSEPLNSLPPDLVITLATPPEKRPYSAEMAAVEVFVSSIASSMNTRDAWLRRVSLATTPLMRNRPSKDIAPEKVTLFLGPVAVVPGASSTAPRMSRVTGSLSITSAL